MEPGVDCLAVEAQPKDFEEFRNAPAATLLQCLKRFPGMAVRLECAKLEGKVLGARSVDNYFVAWLFAALLPDRVDHLVALSVGYPGAAGRPKLEDLQKGWYRLLLQFKGVAEELMQQDDWYLFRELLHGG